MELETSNPLTSSFCSAVNSLGKEIDAQTPNSANTTVEFENTINWTESDTTEQSAGKSLDVNSEITSKMSQQGESPNGEASVNAEATAEQTKQQRIPTNIKGQADKEKEMQDAEQNKKEQAEGKEVSSQKKEEDTAQKLEREFVNNISKMTTVSNQDVTTMFQILLIKIDNVKEDLSKKIEDITTEKENTNSKVTALQDKQTELKREVEQVCEKQTKSSDKMDRMIDMM